MAKHRSHGIDFKRQVAQEFIAGEPLHALANRYDISRTLIRIWVKKFEAGAFDEDAQAADLLESISTTQRYTDVDAAQLVRVYEQAHPRAKASPV
jgi:transposase